MRDHLERFGDAVIAVVTFADPARLAGYRMHLAVPFPVLSDPDLVLYRRLGVTRSSRRGVWSPGTFAMYARLVLSGRRLRLPTEDVRQLGADVVVGRDGRVRLLALPTSPDSRPPVDDLIAALD